MESLLTDVDDKFVAKEPRGIPVTLPRGDGESESRPRFGSPKVAMRHLDPSWVVIPA